MIKIKILLPILFALFGFSVTFAQSTGVVLYGSPNNYNNYGYNTGYYNYNTYDPYNYNYSYNNGYYYQPSNVSVSALNYVPDSYYTSYYNNYNYPYNYYSGNYYNNYQTISVTTNSATSVGPNYATLTGNVTTNNSYYNYNNTVYAWFEYGTSYSGLNQSTTRTNVYSTTSINSNLTNLTCGTTYYYRAAASGPNGTQYGTTMSFTTTSCQNYNYNYNNYYPYYPQYYNNYQYYTPYTYGPNCARTTY